MTTNSMEALKEFDITQGEDVSHKIDSAQGRIDPEQYFEQASGLLLDIASSQQVHLAEDLAYYADKWNPGGFMVFPLGLHKDLGSLRLHVYPPNVERRTAQGPNIHNHGWHLCSLVLGGTYTDTMFTLQEAQSSVNNPEEDYKLYTTHRNGDGTDSLITDGNAVNPISAEEREFGAGEIHTIEAGVYHIPTVPVEAQAATLVFDSPAFEKTTGVLLKDPRQEIARIRKPLEVADIALAQNVLVDTILIN